MTGLLFLLSWTVFSSAQSLDQISLREWQKEQLYSSFLSDLRDGRAFSCKKSAQSCDRQETLYLEVLEDLLNESKDDATSSLFDFVPPLLGSHSGLSLREHLHQWLQARWLTAGNRWRFQYLVRRTELASLSPLIEPLGSPNLYSPEEKLEFCLKLHRHSEILPNQTLLSAVCDPDTGPVAAAKIPQDVPPVLLNQLFYLSSASDQFRQGDYTNTFGLFMFCRHDRAYPCLLVARDAQGFPVRKISGQLWNQPSLGLSRQGKATDERDGHTPAGVYTIDGVMPVADNTLIFGRYRRMILNFIERSPDEQQLKYLIPASHHQLDWWTQSTVARDIGRDFLRIHGTLRRNSDSQSSYYPFFPTSGCVAQRESTYDGINYVDQRLLLDQLMLALGLDAIPKNEVKIRGIFYVVEVDGQKRPVELADLLLWGIQ